MTFFTSEYECKLDVKGRLALPSKIKGSLPEVSSTKLVIRKGFDPHLILYPMMEYEKIHEKISSLNEFDPEQLRLKRTSFRNIAQVDLDSANRMLIPKLMLTYAEIDKDVLLVGTGNYIEMWNPILFNKYTIEDDKEYAKLAQKFL